jgi:enterochelin esterase-like enzyme
VQPWSREFTGRIDELQIESEALRGNALGDPNDRPLWVYMPPGYDDDPDRRFPCVYVIQGLTGQLDMWGNREAFRPTYPENVDALFASGEAPPTLVAFVDCWTSLGGSQFLNSPATGRYQDFLCDEVVAFVDARYRTIPDRDHRGIQGKSSGGYGALVTPMLRPDVFSALASHAGDALFEACYLPGFVRPILGGLPVAAGHDEEGGRRTP